MYGIYLYTVYRKWYQVYTVTRGLRIPAPPIRKPNAAFVINGAPARVFLCGSRMLTPWVLAITLWGADGALILPSAQPMASVAATRRVVAPLCTEAASTRPLYAKIEDILRRARLPDAPDLGARTARALSQKCVAVVEPRQRRPASS